MIRKGSSPDDWRYLLHNTNRETKTVGQHTDSDGLRLVAILSRACTGCTAAIQKAPQKRRRHTPLKLSHRHTPPRSHPHFFLTTSPPKLTHTHIHIHTHMCRMVKTQTRVYRHNHTVKLWHTYMTSNSQQHS